MNEKDGTRDGGVIVGAILSFILGIISLFCKNKDDKNEEAKVDGENTDSWFSGVWAWLKDIGAIVSDEFTTTLYTCPLCGYISGKPFTTCPKCNKVVDPIVTTDVDVTKILATGAGVAALVGGEDAGEDFTDAVYTAARAAAAAAAAPIVAAPDGIIDTVMKSKYAWLYLTAAGVFVWWLLTKEDKKDDQVIMVADDRTSLSEENL